ncbi:hypothetical protein EAH72_31150 [Pseudomonas caspiana]|nr:hypothetical protein [Pseudomonas caspiana]TPG89837.1 hypothetical protein EAH72_31150 [Pseudomonas caspiana]
MEVGDALGKVLSRIRRYRNDHQELNTEKRMTALKHSDPHQIPLTPTSVEGVRSFFEGLCAIVETIERGAPASAAIAVTPSILELLKHYCGEDPRYPRVAANLNVVSRPDIVNHRVGADRPAAQKGIGVPLPIVLCVAAACLICLIVYNYFFH